jgi:hypothetical protein
MSEKLLYMHTKQTNVRMKLHKRFFILSIFKYSFPVYVFFKSYLYTKLYKHNIVNNTAVISSNTLQPLKFFMHVHISELSYIL